MHSTVTPEPPAPFPYTYTDAQNHRLTFRTALDANGRPYVWVEAENLAIGGDIVSMWLTIEQAYDLDAALGKGRGYLATDHTGDALAVVRAEDFTTFEVTRLGDDDETAPPRAVRVVTLTGRLPELLTALTATAERAHQRIGAQAAEPIPYTLTEQAEAAVEEQPAAPRILTADEYDTAYRAARLAAPHAGRIPITDALTYAFAAVGILTPAPDPEPGQCPAQFADLDGEWHQCTEDPSHDPAEGHNDGEWSWPDGDTYAVPEQAEAQQ